MAECHPVGFQWVMEAKNRGATIIHVDPRFTRTSAVADLHVPIRAGSDIAFLGGIIRYVLENDRAFKEYVVAYTNAALIVSDEFRDTEDLDGLFSGWDAAAREYRTDTWQYRGAEGEVPAAGHKEAIPKGEGGRERSRDLRRAQRDETLQHPRCIYQILKRHFSRYTPELVGEICGIHPALLIRVAETLCKSSGRERTAAFCYATGWTQHTVGVQYIRTAAILQALLGNIGRPGGGIMALRGHSSIQGSTDIPTLFDLLPGYIPMVDATLESYRQYLVANEGAGSVWANFESYFVSLMKSWFGTAATRENDWGFHFLPRTNGDHSHLKTVAEMAVGNVKGYFVMGENPAVGSPNSGVQRKALAKLDWLVVTDLALTETAEFWRSSPEVADGEMAPGDIGTEVFFFPAAAHTEKDGSFTQTQRMLQWHHKAVEPAGDCRSELRFAYDLGLRLRELYAGSREEKDRPLQALTWNYPTHGPTHEPDAEEVLAEINGFRLADKAPLSGYFDLKADGSTACGCWIYCGCRKDGINQTARRRPGREQSWVAPEWGWAWPDNRRILYNRASADPEGRPWSERKAYVWWDEASRRWTGHDRADFIQDRPPSYRPVPQAKGVDLIGGADPFIMQADGKAWLFAPKGLLDGPLPAHYEPLESVTANLLYSQQSNPRLVQYEAPGNSLHRPFLDARYPHVVTTYRLTEHHTAGTMSRWLSWLSELMPEMFCEVSPELAAVAGLAHGGWATVSTARGEVECRVLVTRRLRPMRIRGRVLHTIGLPYHWGSVGRVRGDSANDLLALAADPNVYIFESKALTASIAAGRRAARWRSVRPRQLQEEKR
jgi:formate dehydrogenase major subunit